MTDQREPGSTRPWYRHLWVWLLMLPPAATVIFWAVVIWTTAAEPSLVVDDYARAGLTFRQQSERAEQAARLGLSARLHVSRSEGGISLVLEGMQGQPERLRLVLAHPAEAERDLEVKLSRNAAGVYRAGLGRPLDAGRLVELTPEGGQWRLAGRLAAGQDAVELLPPVP